MHILVGFRRIFYIYFYKFDYFLIHILGVIEFVWHIVNKKKHFLIKKNNNKKILINKNLQSPAWCKGKPPPKINST